MPADFSAPFARFRVMSERFLTRYGFREDSFLLLLAVVIGIVTALLAVGFHLLIDLIRDLLYREPGQDLLYSPRGMGLLVLWPALGGLAVGIISRTLFRALQGRGIADVLESVIRSSGFVDPANAIEKVLTAGITIGSGGSGGAEGPIVHIGAAVASGVGALFRLTRTQMPVLIGCGTAAGIAAIFNAPIGGLLFTLEIILQDFSLRAITPIVIASVVANVTIQAVFHRSYHIFAMHVGDLRTSPLSWAELPNHALLGVACGLVGVSLTRLLAWTEHRAAHLRRVPNIVKPAIGGALLGLSGIVYIVLFGHLLLGGIHKPVPFDVYPLPAFFGDGYGFIQLLFTDTFYASRHVGYLFAFLGFLLVAKLIGTCLTIGSGGAGGIIAPSLFLGAVVGGLIGLTLRHPFFPNLQPELYALVGMGAVLAAVVHAPLASTLILLELTGNPNLVLPAMLASVLAVGVARLVFRDSVYTLSLRQRGLQVGPSSDLRALRRIHLEQIPLDPATTVGPADPLDRVIELATLTNATTFVVTDKSGNYLGLVTAPDLQAASFHPEALPLLLVAELLRPVPTVNHTDDLAAVLSVFSRAETTHLPVTTPASPKKVIGLISRATLMRYYNQLIGGT